METHDFPLSPGCQNYCHRSGSVCLGIQVVSARDWGARNSTKPCHESWPNHIGCTVHQDDNRKGCKWRDLRIWWILVIIVPGNHMRKPLNIMVRVCVCVCTSLSFADYVLRSPFVSFAFADHFVESQTHTMQIHLYWKWPGAVGSAKKATPFVSNFCLRMMCFSGLWESQDLILTWFSAKLKTSQVCDGLLGHWNLPIVLWQQRVLTNLNPLFICI